MILTPVYNIHNGIDTSYIYIWLSKSQTVIYIGMTNNSVGPLGRAQGHFNSNGTLRKRFVQQRGFGTEKIMDMILLSFPLPQKREFTGLESSYRESVEYLVMKELLLNKGKLIPNYDIISWHDRTPTRTMNTEVKNIAKTIAANFVAIYPTL